MSLLSADFDEFFAQAIDALRPYLSEIVCIGGCANALYRFHKYASDVRWGCLGTKDVDAGVPQRLPPAGRPRVAELIKKVGFSEFSCGNANEAVIKYGPADRDSAAELEFLCDLSGLSRKSWGTCAPRISR